ncbi:Rieske (2Fe-2S) protein [Thermomonas aquatica]|uniref:Rieske (2Fe-2S) protein n=2 Tax=Thermomonas aquatica TaxID=2202149 RepID=A0A5B7ZSF5_9GAMM|nr:Rieske (2Fe-2S) protein [Thermomonas aquatica]
MAASIRALRIRVVSTSLNRDDGDAPALMRLDAMAPDSLHEVEAVVDGDAESLILHRDAAGRARAWLNVCPHAGRRLDWAPGQFLRSKDGLLVCAVHGASFELQGGECVAGPCRGEALREVAVHCADGEVRLGAPPSTAG